jgi:hypothetical protein
MIWNGGLQGDDDALDPLERVASSLSLRDHLRIPGRAGDR